MKVDRTMRWVGACLVAAGLWPATALAQKQDYDALYQEYLAEARTEAAGTAHWMSDLMGDPKARHVNDLVTISVVESVTAFGSADSELAKGSNASVSLPDPFSKYLEKLVPNSSDTSFSGSGGTSRSTTLSATITARVVEVLPSGDLVVQGVRELGINGDRHVVVLSGVIRPVDILPGNVVPSSRVGQLRIRSMSEGLIKDSLTPGWLVRMINKIF